MLKKFRSLTIRFIKKSRDFVLRSILNYMPLTLQTWLFKLSSRFAGDPDFTWYLGKIYEKRGDLKSAVAAYQKAFQMADQIDNSRVPPRRQAYQFSLERARRNAGLSHQEDPLLICGVNHLPVLDTGTPDSEGPGTFNAIFKYNGMLIKVKLTNNDFAYFDLLVDGVSFRRVKILNDTHHYKFTVKRSGLSHFPARGLLQVRTADNRYLSTKGLPASILEIPHGKGTIRDILKGGIHLEKKGDPPETVQEIERKQSDYLELYAKAKEFFKEELNLELFLMYGTLLGLYRDGDFIPGDDDFDVGYISKEQNPVDVKEEVKAIIVKLVEAGFTVGFNQAGRPFRLRSLDGDPTMHLDVRPVWFQDGFMWAHKQACLPCTLEDFEPMQESVLRSTGVYIPRKPDVFLEDYYGPGWKVPDPSYTNDTYIDPRIIKNLSQVCLTIRDYRNLEQKVKDSGGGRGEIVFKSALDLYPLEEYERKCGWS